jgi:hypothetical protein
MIRRKSIFLPGEKILTRVLRGGMGGGGRGGVAFEKEEEPRSSERGEGGIGSECDRRGAQAAPTTAPAAKATAISTIR